MLLHTRTGNTCKYTHAPKRSLHISSLQALEWLWRDETSCTQDESTLPAITPNLHFKVLHQPRNYVQGSSLILLRQEPTQHLPKHWAHPSRVRRAPSGPGRADGTYLAGHRGQAHPHTCAPGGHGRHGSASGSFQPPPPPGGMQVSYLFTREDRKIQELGRERAVRRGPCRPLPPLAPSRAGPGRAQQRPQRGPGGAGTRGLRPPRSCSEPPGPGLASPG